MVENLAKLKDYRPGIKEGVRLAPLTSFKIGGPAKLFYRAKTKKDLVEAIKLARKQNVPYFLLGGGTNLLVSDEGFDGLVIKVENKEFEIEGEKITAGAGCSLSELVKKAEENGLSGLEFCAGIPGSLGGAIWGNAGIKGQGLGDLVAEVEVFDKNDKIKSLRQAECGFFYRKSRFQTSGEVILQVVFILRKEGRQKIAQKTTRFLKERSGQPRGSSAGSVFKNPEGDSAGKLIEACGLKGRKVGDAQISPQHANWIVNLGHASCRDVLQLILLAKKAVKEQFGIELEEEIRLLGESRQAGNFRDV